MKKTIFLTGSKGFIGSHLLPKLDEFDVYCAERNEVPMIKFDYLIHLAATTTTSQMFLPELFENNIVYAKKIMSIPTRIIYASSTSATELSNPYAYTKRYIEHLGHGCNSTGLRFFNCYGSGNNKGIIKRAINCCLTGSEMNLYGGENIRDFIYIDDAVQAIINALDSQEKIIEVGTGTGMKVYEAVKKIQYLMDRKFPINYMDEIDTDMRVSVAKLGLSGCVGFEDGIRAILEQMEYRKVGV